jgi:hypothetical protein
VSSSWADAPFELVLVEVFVFDAADAVLKTTSGVDVCNPCTLSLTPYATGLDIGLDELAAAAGGVLDAAHGDVKVVVLSDSPDIWPSITYREGTDSVFDAALTWQFSALPSGRTYGGSLAYAPASEAVTPIVGARGAALSIRRAY